MIKPNLTFEKNVLMSTEHSDNEVPCQKLNYGVKE